MNGFQVGDAGGETEGNLLVETVPSWVVDVAIEMAAPKLNKLPFYLLPHSSCQSKQDRQKKVCSILWLWSLQLVLYGTSSVERCEWVMTIGIPSFWPGASQNFRIKSSSVILFCKYVFNIFMNILMIDGH